MDRKQIAGQMMEFYKMAFDNTFNTITVLQDQTEKLLSRFLEKAPWFPEDGKKAVDVWINAYKKGCENFKTASDESYKKVTDYFVKAEKEKEQKAGK